MKIVIIYPFAVIFVSILLNLFVFDVRSFNIGLSAYSGIQVLVIASVILIINHIWLMTSTELTRIKFRMHATPEEWESSGNKREDAPLMGVQEVKRRHSIHRNTTENTIYFILMSIPLLLTTPTTLAIKAWIIGFPVARLGYTYSYLNGKDNLRGFFMT